MDVRLFLDCVCTSLKDEIRRVRELVKEKQRDCQKLKNEKKILQFHGYGSTLAHGGGGGGAVT